MPTVDLWPDDIAVVEPVITPLSILKEQGQALEERTKNILEVKVLLCSSVDSYRSIDPNESNNLSEFAYSFSIVAPLLGNYRYELFRIQHNIVLYPVHVSFDKIYLSNSFRYQHPHEEAFQANNETDFKYILSEIFKADYTRKIINALIAQSQSV